MFFKYWPVLLVDDEPDVLTISRLAMKNFEVYGLPLKIYTANSKEDAIYLMNDDVEVGCSLAVAFLDVVMETERAGLELCDYIRNNLGNKLTQIYIRTGQPGLLLNGKSSINMILTVISLKSKRLKINCTP
jgi:CheY-like chemotaxis protein